MHRSVVQILAAVLACNLYAMNPSGSDKEMPHLSADNPFAQPSTLPYHLPAFDRIKDSDFRPAFEAGMAEQRQEVATIDRNPDAPSFENTVVALEKSGRLLNRVSSVFFNLNSSNTNPEILKIASETAPKLAAHHDSIMLDEALFSRLDAVYTQRANLKLDPESLYLLERTHTEFVRAGAKLSPAEKPKLRELNEQIASLTTQFQQNVLKATKDSAVVVDNLSDLDGLSTEQIGAAAQAAKARGLEGKWVLTLQNTTIQPVLAQLRNRAMREKVYKASIGRAQTGAEDNKVVLAKIVKLRAEKANLLGYPNFAAYALADQSAGTPDAVNQILTRLVPAAVANAKKEAEDNQKLIDAQAAAGEGQKFALEPWDWAFYSEQVKKSRFGFDEAEVKPYLELNHVLQDGVFYAAHELFGLTFKERHDLPVYQPDVRVFEVFNADGSALGLFLVDYFARDNKRGGAWSSGYVDQSKLLGFKPVIVNNLNIPKPSPGQPALLTFDEVRTMFHEFGHALHALLSDVNYPSLAGTNVPRDFVEFPSQYNEMWAREPKVLANYAKHYQTGAPMPQAMLDKVLAAEKYGQGYSTTEYVAAALLDQEWHQMNAEAIPSADKVMDFQTAALKKNGIDYAPVPPRYFSPYFTHAFTGGYAAGYYSYIWAEVLARDTEQWFHTHGGLQRANGEFLRAKILSRGRSTDPEILFEQFYGGKPDINPLLEHRGLK
ncbi:MAG TPA: M3 family metallopeptidase [Candidatus Acidoferrales bacterium]|nr:M3 family metallopeptidase [Candidatus Acidoferrales bacterium]